MDGQRADEQSNFNRITLERLKLLVIQGFPGVELLSLNSSAHQTFLTDSLYYRLKAAILGREATQDVAYPATWWEHFKQAHFPAWALARWPVRYTTVRVDARALFPDLAVMESRHRVMYQADTARILKDGADDE